MAKRKSRRKRTRRRSLVMRLLPRFLLVVVVLTLLLTLPFRWLAPPTTAFIWRAGHSGLGGGPPCTSLSRQWVGWDEISKLMPLAVIAAEDQRFPDHWGIDVGAIATALDERIISGRVRGASTITQQLVKNLYLWPGQSLPRKALEAWLTLSLEITWSKKRILEVYMNVVQFGDCTFGVEAASLQFFGKPASALNAQQAARLAAALPNPVRFRVDQPGEQMQQKVSWILEQMQSLGGEGFIGSL